MILVKSRSNDVKYQMESREMIAIVAFIISIAVFSSSYEALKAAGMNPVKTLRYE